MSDTGLDRGRSTPSEPAVTPTVFCRVLGPIAIEIDGVPVDLGGRITRRVMAALSAGGSAPVPDEDLIEQVWGDARPGNVIQALRAIIWRLRAGLGPDIGPRYLVRERTGYALTIPGSLTDRWELPTRVAHGLRHLADGEAAAAITDLESAVALWRGEPWQDLSPAPELAGIRASLAELHDVAIEELQAARIAAADTTRAIAALAAAVVATPYRERRWELLALALYRSGRQAEALAALRRAREQLITDIGIEPGPALHTLEHRILRQDPELLSPADVLRGSTDRRTRGSRG